MAEIYRKTASCKDRTIDILLKLQAVLRFSYKGGKVSVTVKRIAYSLYSYTGYIFDSLLD